MDTQVIVVGAGPAGLMLAGELRLGGAEVIVLELPPGPTTRSRASTLHARTMEVLEQRGLLATLGSPPNDLVGHFGGLPLDLSELPTRYPGQWKVPQARLEKLLADWASSLGADIWREHELRGLADLGGKVRAEIATPAGAVTMTCAYLAGCDGEDSAVRRLGGFAFLGSDATKELLHADVIGLDIPARRFQRYPGGLATAAIRDDGVARVMVHEFGRQARARDAGLSFAEVAAAWARVTGEDISGGTPASLFARTNASRQAARYQLGRVLLAGDAAHQQMPVGGQAINLAVQDAMNLGWKLAAHVTGRAPAGLLDSYHTERHPVGQRVLANIEAQVLLLTGGPEVEATRQVLSELLGHAAARTHLGRMISGLDVRYGHGDHPLTGARMPDFQVATGNRVTSVSALLCTGHGVLIDLSGDPARLAWLESAIAPWAGRVDLIPAKTITGPAGLAESVLLRPDGYVAWAGNQAADPLPELSRWFGQALLFPTIQPKEKVRAVRHAKQGNDTFRASVCEQRQGPAV